ncbi:ISL3 family transposase [Myroides odoratimimus]|uniref:ISL3 family transposase n=1 Tax=Myroides odoratimimus TaxID=76832 RepID=UPI003D2F8821
MEICVAKQTKPTTPYTKYSKLPSSKLHSYYIRKIVDLPIFGKQTLIKLKARKFYCSTLECPLKIFTERFKSIFSSYQRRSDRLTKKLLNLVILTGGRPIEKICAEFSVTISDTSLLRIIVKQELPTTTNVTHLGVDDWAIRKRERYGSILIDLNTNKPIGLLKDREENTFYHWLTQNKQVQLISRDRFINYQRASTQGAPQALQVADRWHLLKNLGETVRKILDREYAVIQKMRKKNTMTIQPENKRQKTKTSNHQLQRFTQVKELLAQSKSHREISKLLHMSRVTVKKYELYDELPTIHCQSSTGIEKHLEYIESRIIQEPTILLKTLHFELKNRGYTGAYNTLSDSLKRFQISIGKAARNKVILPSNLVF